MFWKHLQKRAVWLAWQNIYKNLITLIPCPVDCEQISVGSGILPFCQEVHKDAE